MAQVVALLLAILAGMVLSAEAPRPCCYLGDKGQKICCGYDERLGLVMCCQEMVGYRHCQPPTTRHMCHDEC